MTERIGETWLAPEAREEGSQVQAAVRPRRAWITIVFRKRAPEVRGELRRVSPGTFGAAPYVALSAL